MALTHWGFLYTASGADPERDVTVVDTGSCRTVLVGMERPEQGVDAARELVEQHGVQLIELCGGFGPTWTARILDAIGHRVPVGAVAYGPESVDGVHEIFS
ncbi:DUF6506 family protein [Pseudonocardia parietis]|uniref:Uncharacterized protein n=1 Tax=Pseudonocardia parietis TaxID=570936 RepID=A0ABS4VUF1_9PSEU|nr:DUF6506 family protein [Pseudonocardia parietis]MBP2367547.1 hypothetical protein [Pseudonocardia parietis]